MDDLVKKSEIAKTEFEHKVMNSPFYHQISVHPRTYYVMAGIMALLFGIFLLEPSQSVRISCFWIGVIELVIFYAWVLRPCKCGKTPVLTATTRSGVMRMRIKSFWVIAASIGIIGALTILSLGFGILGFHGFNIAIGIFLILTGCIWTFLGLVNRVDWFLQLVFIPRVDQQKIAMLKGETEEELHKLIDFHLKAGNFSVADEYSHKLLALVETQQKIDPK